MQTPVPPLEKFSIQDLPNIKMNAHFLNVYTPYILCWVVTAAKVGLNNCGMWCIPDN